MLGGGVIQDFVEEGRTSMDIDLQNFSVEDPTTISTTMWDNEVCAYNIFLIATEKSPFTGNTRLRFTTLDGEGKPNRGCHDNIYVRQICYKQRCPDEDVFAANGGSGKVG